MTIQNEPSSRITAARWRMVAYIVVLVAASILYRVLVEHRLEQTSALFIGIPAFLAIVTVLFARPKSATGTILVIITVALCISGVFLGEGFICIVMAAPLFYAIGLLVGLAVDFTRRRQRRDKVTLGIFFLLYLPLSFEGVTPQLSFSREESVTVSRTIAAPASQVQDAIAQSPDISRRLPIFLRAGFPVPTEVSGGGLHIGARRRIHFAGGEGHPGDLELTVRESAPGRVVFVADSDHSKIAHWLAWKSSTVEWKALDPAHTEVRWTLRYRRDLDPSWYFGPWERYAVSLAADYLIQSNATPAAVR